MGEKRDGAGVPPALHPQVEDLPTDECWRLLQNAPLARLALVNTAGDPEIYPVNVQIHQGTVLIRSAADRKVQLLTERPNVALEADGGSLRVRWSVVVHAKAEIIDGDAAVWPPSSEGIPSWYPGEKTRQIRLIVGAITGRRFLVSAGARLRNGPADM